MIKKINPISKIQPPSKNPGKISSLIKPKKPDITPEVPFEEYFKNAVEVIKKRVKKNTERMGKYQDMFDKRTPTAMNLKQEIAKLNAAIENDKLLIEKYTAQLAPSGAQINILV